MDPKHTVEILRHLEKQHDHLMDAYRSMTHELHKLQVEEEMLMRKFYELMVAKGLNKKAGVIEETVNEAVDSALDSEDIEEESEEEVDKVLTALAGETAAQLPEAARKEKLKQPAKVVGDEVEDEAIAEGADDEEELEEIRTTCQS
ncbi:vacuolar protein sorting-associated protein 24 homolog 1-like isoform X2 [Diospyros lotus]|uniref:vacuolar protein sorting-associated protein 24 homolog 1-like isoform X2 n=1 Tax=Diospyros lotus TaxID=55363 RepID=UPI0022520ACC|nr:vacuolar protein sorting-associated protein 24 homolog 1-like isoform X2 [Diospyros lotus]XP_052195210.1 vacuolar protein sorting-associated protein 24 homolog 1-like isoform X2 [Diospyros lotus]XP_052195216.1 vacuolar protein sorting-associated protein 24 homolog 1-like isoform X2 [Diospyros lotus]XP_052195224.1 vacuolar protein sorting-associated protein 24 homolog 1-like isoform X2 [Diospyros lotus]